MTYPTTNIAITILLGCVLAVFGAPAFAQADPVDEDTPTVEQLLKGEPQADDYVDEPRCIRSHAIRSTEVLDDKHVAFELSRKRFYLVQFERRCPGLQRDNPVFYESSGGRVCVHDTIRGSYATGVASFQPGMPCAIPSFTSVTKEELVLLKDALKAERRKQRQERKERRRLEREARKREKATS